MAPGADGSQEEAAAEVRFLRPLGRDACGQKGFEERIALQHA